ncbi:MAG: hypothetical protein PF450_07995 [Bacteroidales bacterium]|jgi:Ca2+/Na+ antiporter|nr:hypothetical protein [Bacteroidales bacterium]
MASFLGITFPLLLIALSGHIIWKSTDGFEIAADYLGRKMSRGVKGATINAVASSMPEFLTTMFFLFYVRDTDIFADSFSGGLGVVAGSAVFNILIIPLAVILFAGILSSGEFTLDRKVLSRDGLFLIFSNIVLIIIVAQPEIKTVHGLILVLIYFIYLSSLRKGLGFHKEYNDEVGKYYVEKVPLKFRHFFLLDLKQIMLNGKNINKRNGIIVLLISTGVMSVGTWMLVEGTKLLGEAEYGAGSAFAELFKLDHFQGLDIPLIFLSVLIAAAATSIPDTMISVRDARKGNHDDSISNAIGSNIFDISFAIGFPLMLYTLFHGGQISLSPIVQLWSFGILIAMWVINILVVLLFLPKRLNIRIKGIALFFIYILFLLFILLEKNDALEVFFMKMIDFIQGVF